MARQYAKLDPVKHCETCGVRMKRKRFNDRLEDRTRFLARRNCSQSCGNTKDDPTRGAYLRRAQKSTKTACEDCRNRLRLTIHHIDRDWRNNGVSNLATLCNRCHTTRHWREDWDGASRPFPLGASTAQP